MVNKKRESSNTLGGGGGRTKGERMKKAKRVSRQASPSHSVQSVQLADLVTSARGRRRGGIEGRRGGGERERRRRGGSGVDRGVAVCGVGTLGGSR